MLASLLTPIAATIWFTAWPHDAPPRNGPRTSLLPADRVPRHSADARAAAQRRGAGGGPRRGGERAPAKDSATQLRLIADSVPVLISYIGNGRFLFTNRLYETWFGATNGPWEGRG